MKKSTTLSVLIVLCLWLGMSGGAMGQQKKTNAAATRTPTIGKPYIKEIHRLAGTVNSASVQEYPVVSPDGKTLFFSRREYYKNKFGVEDPEDIWYSTLQKSGLWSEAVSLGSHMNNERPNYITCIAPPLPDSRQNQMMAIIGSQYHPNNFKKKEPLRYSYSTNLTTWTKPKPIRIEGLAGFGGRRSDAFLTADRKWLLISHEDGKNQRDLHACPALGRDRFGEPKNLGPTINTPGSERSPYLTADGKILYFSSDGHPNGQGKHDIYVSQRLNEDSWTEWSIPQNMGPVMNTDQDELYISLQNQSNIAYFTRGGEHLRESDIYQAKIEFGTKIVLVRGKVVNAFNNQPVPGSLVKVQINGQWVGMTSVNQNTGTYDIQLLEGDRYEFFALYKDITSDKVIVDLVNGTPPDTQYELRIPDIKLEIAQLQLEETLEEEGGPSFDNVVNNPPAKGRSIFFATNKSTIEAPYFPVIETIVEGMLKSPTAVIDMTSFVDGVGKNQAAMNLAVQRLQMISSYLLQRKISNNRIFWRFCDAERAGEKNAESLQKNRRVDLFIRQ